MSKPAPEQLLIRIPELARHHARGELGDAAYACLYFLYWQIASHGSRFASRKFRHDPRPEPQRFLSEIEQASGAALDALLHDYFLRYQFNGVIPNVSAALLAWLGNSWPLQLCNYIPKPMDVLRMQVQGLRPVTLLADYPRLLRPVMNKANAFVFMQHDLEHAYKFFHDPELLRGQRNFFERIAALIDQGGFAHYLVDQRFADKFDYLISDMNTHWMHSVQYLRAILIEFHLRKEHKQGRDRLSQQARAAISELLQPLLAPLADLDMDYCA